MSIKITGMDELINTLDNKFGPEAVKKLSDKALLKGAEVFVKILNETITASGHKGYSRGRTVGATTISKEGNRRVLKIHWNDGSGTHRIIHLNEWGTVINPNPPRKGAIARAMRNGEEAYRQAIKQAILEEL